jgi:hypothetical protein
MHRCPNPKQGSPPRRQPGLKIERIADLSTGRKKFPQQNRMNNGQTLNDIAIRTELMPGDLGYVVHRHGALYAIEHGFGIEFESYVAAGLHEFHARTSWLPRRRCTAGTDSC